MDSKYISQQIEQLSGRNLIRYGNKIINLDHVKEIDFPASEKENCYEIVFSYSDGTKYINKYPSFEARSLSFNVLFHCIEHGLFSLSVTSEYAEHFKQR